MSAHQLTVGSVVFNPSHNFLPFTDRRESPVSRADRELLRRIRRALGLKPGDDLLATIQKLAQTQRGA